MSLNLNRRCRPVFEGNDTTLSDMDDENRDPFKTSDNEDDVDYQPAKKKRADIKVAAHPSTLLNRFKKSAPKRLSAKERLNRLKQKFSSKNPSSEIAIAHCSNQTNVASQNNDVGKENDIDKQLESSEKASFASYNHFFDDEGDSSERSVVNKNEVVDFEQFPSGHGPQNSVLDVVLELREQMHEMMSNFTLMRKQICRLELKSLAASNGRSAFQNEIEPELLLDLDEALAKEGLPIKTSVELNDFERKLRQDTKYRTKLVSITIISTQYTYV